VAFTGNKFEFRMPGSSQSIAGPNTVLNTIMAEKLSEYADVLEMVPGDMNDALHDLIKAQFTEHSRIIFNGNGYDQSWVTEAERRGLSNLATMAQAVTRYMSDKNVALFEKHGIMSRLEMSAREEVDIENYCNIISIEAKTLLGMTTREIIPAISSFEGELCRTLLDKQSIFGKDDSSVERVECLRLSKDNSEIADLCGRLSDALDVAPTAMDAGTASYYHDKVLVLMEEMRLLINDAEGLVPGRLWPYPTYRRLLFSV